MAHHHEIGDLLQRIKGDTDGKSGRDKGKMKPRRLCRNVKQKQAVLVVSQEEAIQHNP